MPATPSEAAGGADGADVRRLHPLTPFFELILLGRQFVVPLLVLLFANRGDGSQFLPAIPIVVGTAYGVVKWRRFTYTFDGRRLVIDEGVLTRKQRIVPLDRIQQVELISKLRHRLLGVTVLRVDTAGGGGDAEVDLSVVSVAEATRLRAVLGAPGDPSRRPAHPEAEGRLVRVGTGRLALAGMTGSELAVMLTILFWVVQLVDDLPDSFLEDVAGNVTAPSSVGGFLTAAAALLVLWFGLAATASILKNHGFTLTRTGEDLRVSRGLLDRREGSMPAHRLQAVRVRATIVRRALRLVEVVLQSGGGSTASRAGLSRIDVPILDAGGLAPLLANLLPAPPPGPETYVPAPPVARRRAIVRRVVPAVVIATAVAVVDLRALPVGALLLVAAAVAGELAYRGLAHAWERDLLLARSGGLARETVIVPAAKAQSTRLRTTPFQRRAGLATLHVEVAGKGPTPVVKDGDATRLRALQRAVLASSASRADESLARQRA